MYLQAQMTTILMWLLLVVVLQVILVFVVRYFRFGESFYAAVRPLLDWFDTFGRTAEGEQWRATYIRIMETPPGELAAEAARLISQHAHRSEWLEDSMAQHSRILRAMAPQLQRFFDSFCQQFDYLSFDGVVKCLDRAGLRETSGAEGNYAVVGETADDGVFFAVKLDGRSEAVFVIDVDERRRIYKVEIDAPSAEHFVCLQHAMAHQDK